MNEYNKIIKKIGEELGIKITFLSDNWLTVLEMDGITCFIQGYKFDLNDHGIGNILDDKGLFYDVLRYKNLPVIEHHVLFQNYNKNEVLKYFHEHNREIIIKGNIGTKGEEVFKINSETLLWQKLNDLFRSQYSVSLCPFYHIINEYRVIVLNGDARIIYGKTKPEVIGDGKKTIKELACEYNLIYEDNNELLEHPNDIPNQGEKVILNYQFNLSRGAKMFTDIDSDLKKELTKLALLVTNTLNITFGSVDIIKTADNNLFIMEANSGVMMDNYIRLGGNDSYNEAYKLYKDAIKLMFDIKKEVQK